MTVADGFVRSGKVRDLYALGEDRLLLVASDRLSAFDVVLPTPVPDKGRVLTGLSRFWFAETRSIVTNHLLSAEPSRLDLDRLELDPADLRGRSMVCRRASVLPIEVIVRGYLAGSGWRDYRQTRAIGGQRLPIGLRESDRLPEPIMTPSTKAESGSHDENIDLAAMVDRLAVVELDRRPLGFAAADDLAERIRDRAIALYRFGLAVTARAGIILADTKFEFGLLPDGALVLIDEVLTPDSSRFWDTATYRPGGPQASYDKQFVRDWLESQPWAKTVPGPALPDAVVDGTRARYVEAFERITGASFARYLQEDVIAR